MSAITIDANRAYAMIKQGAILVDIRNADEHARENIAGALHIPISKLGEQKLEAGGKAVIYHCKGGNRTRMNVELLLKASGSATHLMEGGIDGWKVAGHPVRLNSKQPIEMMRQVQIAAGFFALLGAVLGFTVHPGFYALSAAVGAGLMFSGISGTCAMASVLKMMQWNRISA
jgi:rhodanese-related sulfurtransferase